jgi:hypothetical protein
MIGVSAVEYPAIIVIPEATSDETLTLGTTYTVSIYTDYAGDDIWGWQFTLYYDPDVLHGGINNTDTFTGDGLNTVFWLSQSPVVPDSEEVYVGGTLKTRDVDYVISYDLGVIGFFIAPSDGAVIKVTYLYNGVVNGDLITTAKHPDAMFEAGTFNNTLGKLSLTVAWFYYETEPPPTTSGPGILANVTFTVVGYGSSNIAIGLERDETELTGYSGGNFYSIVDAYTMPDHIQHGYFRNKFPGDIDGDWDCDYDDFLAFADAYLSIKGAPKYNIEADFDLSDGVDYDDFLVFAANYLKTFP